MEAAPVSDDVRSLPRGTPVTVLPSAAGDDDHGGVWWLQDVRPDGDCLLSRAPGMPRDWWDLAVSWRRVRLAGRR